MINISRQSGFKPDGSNDPDRGSQPGFGSDLKIIFQISLLFSYENFPKQLRNRKKSDTIKEKK